MAFAPDVRSSMCLRPIAYGAQTALRITITIIIESRPEKEMFGIDTGRVITMMTDE